MSQKIVAANSFKDEEGGIPIGGVTAFTTIDFPGRLAAVLYTQGCAWRCRYCYNTHLRPFDVKPEMDWQTILAFLRTRRGFLDGVVFCGGEPTSHAKLPSAMKTVREMGFQIGLHTAGMFPERLREVIPFCDWIGMDIKAPFDRYEKVTQVPQSGAAPRESTRLVLESGIEHEFRTTLHPELLSEEDILEAAKEISGMGAQNYALQLFRSEGCSGEGLKKADVLISSVSAPLQESLRAMFKNFQIRD